MIILGKKKYILSLIDELENEEDISVDDKFTSKDGLHLKIHPGIKEVSCYCHDPITSGDTKVLKAHLPSHRKHFKKQAVKLVGNE